jgi:hypothetical protein
MKADSGGSLIYIIVSIALLIISAMGKSKKKPVNQPMPEEEPDYTDRQPIPPSQQTPEWPKELEDIFGKMFDPEQPKPEEKPKSYEGEYKPETYPSFDNYQFNKDQSLEVIEEENQSLETIKAVETEEYISPINTVETEVKSEVDRVFVLEEFEIDKAVIYSEIINRKYF